MSDAISRFDAQKLVYDYCHARTVEGRQLKSPAVFTTHTGTDLAEAIGTLPAVQPDAAPAGNLTARGNAATWALYDANLTRMGALQPDPLCECGMTGPCKWTECKAPILSAHVNETPKSEHDARDVLTPATKGGA